MEEQKHAFRIGVFAIVLALGLRSLLTGRLPFPLHDSPWPLAAFLQTGHVIRYPETQTVPTVPTEPEQTKPLQITQTDAAAVELYDLAGCEPDVQTLLSSPLSWQLRASEPTVLILHTHATESYTKQPWQDYTEDSAYRTLDADYNMLSVGQALAEVLEQGGIRVIHDQMLHDHPSYSGSYEHARQSIASYLAAYPSICMVIDLHRDALDFENDPQLTTSATVDGQRSAQLMLVAGTDKNLDYPDWQANLSLGLKLTAVLEKAHPGITRPIQLREQRFNLDMTPGSLLVEVGANGNTHQEALVAVRALGEAILRLADGANLENRPPF